MLTFFSVILGLCAAASYSGPCSLAATNAGMTDAPAAEGQTLKAQVVLSATPTRTGPDSGIYGLAGGGGGAPPGTSVVIRHECVKVIDPATHQTVATASCKDGHFRIALPPGRYLVVGPGRQANVEVGPGEWKAMSFMLHIPGAHR